MRQTIKRETALGLGCIRSGVRVEINVFKLHERIPTFSGDDNHARVGTYSQRCQETAISAPDRRKNFEYLP